MNLNKVFEPADLSYLETHDEGLDWPIRRERKYFENMQAMRAFRQGMVLDRSSQMLGVGAGRETTGFWLTNFVGMVFMTDLYINDGRWSTAPGSMLELPEPTMQVAYDSRRIHAINMSGLDLRWPNDYFDGVFSSGSIEHFGPPDAIMFAASEMGRVLKPGGIMAISTEFALADFQPNRVKQLEPDLFIFDLQSLFELIIEPSGCELMDAVLVPPLNPQRIGDAANLAWLVNEFGNKGLPMPVHDALLHKGVVFTSVSLALRKSLPAGVHTMPATIRGADYNV